MRKPKTLSGIGISKERGNHVRKRDRKEKRRKKEREREREREREEVKKGIQRREGEGE